MNLRAASRSVLLAALVAAGLPAAAGSIAPALDEALISASPDELLPVVVMLESYPERVELLDDVRGMNRETRREHVVEKLQSLAAASQRRIHAKLRAFPDEASNIRVLWGINGVALRATPQLIEILAELPEVRWVLHDSLPGHLDVTRLEYDPDPTEIHVDLTGPTGGDVSGPNPDAAVRGELVAMGAQQVWEQLGYTGAGVIVAIADTGVDRTHPDLADHIWTNLDELPNNGIDDDGNGFVDDTWGWEFCLDNNDPSQGSHGTQVAGQVAGDGTGGTVTGMAPDVELMALGLDCDTPSYSWAASDYAIANGAHLISQSYSWWWTDQPDYEAFRRQGDAELAAGLIHINSGGNHGGNASYPIPYNVSTPGNVPSPWVHPDQTLAGGVSSTIAVGNISYSTDQLMGSSSRGPSAWEEIRANTDPAYPYTMAPEYQDYPYENGAQMGLIKPDISAYGDQTYSTCPGPSYCQFSGTSSAQPHVAGTLALMLSANPEATPAELTEALMTAAEHRGTPGKNNDFGVGLVQAFAAVQAVESGVVYLSHTFDDSASGNGDGKLDPGETVTMAVTVRSATSDQAITGLQAILSSPTPEVTIHNQVASFPTLPALGTASSDAPHFSLSIDPAACTTVATFDLELRYGGKVRRSTFDLRVGDETPLVLLADDFESDAGWTTGGTASDGFWVREDPNGVTDSQSRLTNPEDDSSSPGTDCYVTGNANTGNPNGDDVDGGNVTLTSPPFGSFHMLSLDLAFDRWYYDSVAQPQDAFRTEISSDGGATWILVDELVWGYGDWDPLSFNLLALLPATDDMRLRFTVSDGVDSIVEGGVDELYVTGTWVDCQDHSPPAAQAPNPVGDSLRVEVDASGHTVLSWNAPPADAGHDPATLYRIERAASPAGPFVEAGSATTTRWVDVDALLAPESFHYRIVAENAGGRS